MTDYEHDVFVSYRQGDPDRSLVRERLVPALKVHGFNVCVDYESFRIGRPLVLQMERAVVSSRYSVAILSQRYLDSAFTEFERVLARQLSLETREARLLAVRIEAGLVPPLDFRAHLWIEMTEDFGHAVEQLVAELRRDPGA
jgi:hypothetical protein